MEYTLLLIITKLTLCYGISIRVLYSEYAPSSVRNGSLQEILGTTYIDGRGAKTLVESQYISTLEEITYRKELKEEQVASVFNFRNLNFFSMVNNTQKKIPNFRNLPKIKMIQIKECNITNIEANSVSNVGVETLDFQRNQIMNIEDKAFGKKVNSVYLNCNLLTLISSNWFRNASNLQYLNLESNKIKILQKDLFKKFTNLQELYLAKNEILTLESGSLSGPTSILSLDLGVNDISILNADIFSNEQPVYIFNLRISFNRLSFIAEDLMNQVTVLQSAIIYGNPWQCPCVRKLHNWLSSSETINYSLFPEPSCVYTIEKSKDCIEDVFLNDELYNYYISHFTFVDTKSCSNETLVVDKTVSDKYSLYKWIEKNIEPR